ncbi:MAG: metalloenzyme [Thermoanaerobacteraceae bacterium]|nr:metalloenzyme [Thermoanaerobacteraceae bacterium]
MKVILFFVDGFGLGEPVKTNPYFSAATPFLDNLLKGHNFYRHKTPLVVENAMLRAIDARLGVPGVPQSATGQTTIWTGVNAPGKLGFHLHGLPNKQLKSIIDEHNIYKRLQRYNKKVAFANAYRPGFFSHPNGRRYISVSTYAALAAGLTLRTVADLKEGRAVFQDITNEGLRNLGVEVPLLSARQAAGNLLQVSRQHDFVIFEFFQSDIAGHKRDLNRAVEIWQLLDEFIAGLVTGGNLDDMLLILTSDHGNMEDLSHGQHTCNPVPLLVIGKGHRALPAVSDLTGIAPAIEYILKEVSA